MHINEMVAMILTIRIIGMGLYSLDIGRRVTVTLGIISYTDSTFCTLLSPFYL